MGDDVNARARLIVQENDRRDSYGGPIVVLDVDLADYVRGVLSNALSAETVDRLQIGIRLDVPIVVAPSEWLILERAS